MNTFQRSCSQSSHKVNRIFFPQMLARRVKILIVASLLLMAQFACSQMLPSSQFLLDSTSFQTDHNLRRTIPASVHSMSSNIVIHKLLIQTFKLWHDRMMTLDLETQYFTSIEDHTSRPQTDLEFHDFAF